MLHSIQPKYNASTMLQESLVLAGNPADYFYSKSSLLFKFVMGSKKNT